MPAPVINVKSLGVQRPSTSAAAGPADEFASSTTINPAGVLTQLRNNASIVNKVLGDGRLVVPIQGSTPGSLAAGQIYLLLSAGVTYLVYVDSTGTPVAVTNGSPAPIVPTVFALTISVPQQLDTILVDTGGCIQWQCSISDLITGRRAIYTIAVVNDGTNSADAVNAGILVTGGAAIGTPDVGSQVTFTVTFSGAGVSQHMNLFVTPSVANLQAAIVRTPLVTT